MKNEYIENCLIGNCPPLNAEMIKLVGQTQC